MKRVVIFVIMVAISNLSNAMETAVNVKTNSETAAAREQQTVIFDSATAFITDPWHFGKEVTRLQAMIARALAITQDSKKTQGVFQSAIEPLQQKLKKLSDEMEPRKQHLANAQKSQDAFAPTIVTTRKAHLTDSLLAAVSVLNEVIALQDVRIQALMKRNEEQEAVLKAKS